jgi:hypothetical protein
MQNRITRALVLTACLLLWMVPVFAGNVQRDPIVIHEITHDVSLPLSVMAKNAPAVVPGQIIMREHRAPKHIFGNISGFDPVVQQEFLPNVLTTNLLNFDAITGVQGGAIPPDTNGSVGATQFVLITNFDYAVYDKTTGKQLLAPTRINNIWSGFGGQCQSDNGGDPIVLWDKLAQRWLVEQLEYFVANQNLVCVAVSTGTDATGTYNRYSFSFGSALPDYPKLAVWPDAYYLSVNSFGIGAGEPCALNRTAMLAGTTAIMVCFPPNPANFGFLPSDVDGTTPPPSGAPNHFLELGSNTKTLNEFDFHVDFVNTKNSTFTGPNPITIPNYALVCGGGTCIPQPSPGELLDTLGDRLMYRLAYRNFGDHESMVVDHTVKPGTGSTAVGATRWYELRATPPGSSFSLYQAGTVQQSTSSLWMGSIAMDKQGNIALGASTSSKTTKPGIVYYGRIPTDPLGKMEAPKTVAKGTGVQVNGGSRWGDYSSMSVDPTDDCTFWYSQEYYKANGTNWITHVTSFKFTSCQ